MTTHHSNTRGMRSLVILLLGLFVYVSCATPPIHQNEGGAQETVQAGGERSEPSLQDTSTVEQVSPSEPAPKEPGVSKESNSGPESNVEAVASDNMSVDASEPIFGAESAVPEPDAGNVGPDMSEPVSQPDEPAIPDTSKGVDEYEAPQEAATPDSGTTQDNSSPPENVTPPEPRQGPETVVPEQPPSLYKRQVVGNGAPLASIGPSGSLVYRRYANQGQSNEVHILPDFSYAGYKRGGVAIPSVPVRLTLSPTSGDSRARIQAAIDTVSKRTPDAQGFRGAILLKKGTYNVSDTLRIRAGGVVLRGEGQGKTGTLLVATKRSQHELIQIAGAGSGFGEVKNTRVKITSSFVPVGSTVFDVSSAAKYAVGDTIVVLRTPNQTWIDALVMGKYGWKPSSYTIGHERRITAIKGNTIHIDIPIVDTIETGYGGGSIYKAKITGRIFQCGVEDLRLVSQYSGNTDEKHAWIGIKLSRVVNSWVRRVTTQYFGFAAVSFHSQSNFNTVEEVAMLDPISQITGGRRYPFNVAGGVGNLFQRCFARGGRHNFVTSSRVTGPHVWLDCLATTNYNDDGPHHRWATGLLFDNTSSKALNVQNRTSSGSGHGWAGAQVLFWNAQASTIICDAPKGAMNWSIGCVGKKSQGSWAPNEPYGWWESAGKVVKPRSIYLQQLADRLGAQAVNNVTTAAQRKGRIWPLLALWAGEGRLDNVKLTGGDPGCSTGIRSGTACCAKSCGRCGGSGCSKLPGGSSACCTGTINAAAKSCTTNKPPCKLP